MFHNYLVIAFRNLWKHKLFSFINVVGLASGIMVCLLALMQVKSTFEYDLFHPHPERTYRIITDVTGQNGNKQSFAMTPLPLGDLLPREYGFIEKSARIYFGLRGEVSGNGKTLYASGAFVDPTFFEMFGYKLSAGRPALEPNTVVLTSATAQKFFGAANPVGKTVLIRDQGHFTVTGVLAPAEKSHLNFEMLASMATRQTDAQLTNWNDTYSACTYILAKKGMTRQTLDQALPVVSARINRLLGTKSPIQYGFRAQAMSEITPDLEDLISITGAGATTIGSLLSFGVVALVILLLAGFNYVNLTLARSLSRAREVGVRKATGALRSQLIGQFLIESTVLALLALGLAYLLLMAVEPLPIVQRLTQNTRYDAALWLYFCLFALATGAVAGLVPARVLSAYQPMQVLRGQIGPRLFRGVGWRKALIVAQFSVTLTAAVFMLVMYRQFSYMGTGDYGFNRENILNIPLTGSAADVGKYRLLANGLSKQVGVERVGAVSESMGHYADDRRMRRERRGDAVPIQNFAVDHNFVPSMGLTVVAGQNLPESVSDSAGHFILINETAVKALQFGSPQQAVGQTLWLDSTDVQVAGVLKDFNFMSFKWTIMPLMVRYEPKRFRVLQVSVAGGAAETVVSRIEKLWKQINPREPLSYGWYQEELYEQHMHWDDQLFFYVLIGMALSIACLGLLGMVTYTTETRTKEVGIRKVMGATVMQIVVLLSKSFVSLLLIAGLIALPAGYSLGRLFLQEFAYHVSVGAETLAVCFGAMLLIGGLTIGFRTYRAALANPTDSLRNE
ncbi:ABC transporter permease [Larkinella insperata]|uniref:ABC transporter permease n=1 Tax=Larkinella insperata TaxID=332158 RepID=A0ABW3QEQ6_9BACT|nr:ABC transporter permease [Larkinella insperata]